MSWQVDEKRGILYRNLEKPLPTLEKGGGIYLHDVRGKKYLDASSGPIAVNIGYSHPKILDTIKEQIEKVTFAHASQWTSEPAEELAQELTKHTPSGLNRVFFVSGGSEAVESAFKVAYQYHYEKSEPSKRKIVSVCPSYHGATLWALSTSCREEGQQPYKLMLADFPKIQAPYSEYDPDCAWELEEIIKREGEQNVAAFIIETIGGVSTGALAPSNKYFEIIRRICDEYNVLLIVDEVMVGYGRTGKLFAVDRYDFIPDIMALSKGMASGYAPLGGIVIRDKIFETFKSKSGRFVHGHTYQGNPLACAVGLGVLEVIQEEKLVENARKMGRYLLEKLNSLEKKHELIAEIRGRGLHYGMELAGDREKDKPISTQLTKEAFKRGLIIYPRNSIEYDHVLISPPLIVSKDQIDEITKLLDNSISSIESPNG